MQTTNATPTLLNSDAEDYLVQNGWIQLPADAIAHEAIIFLKGYRAVILTPGAIDFKVCPEPMMPLKTNSAAILFRWQTTHYYKGWDGNNIFQLMMLLEFFGAVKLKHIPAACNRSLVVKEMAEAIDSIFKVTECQ
jgi:hypothetical protein